jgi:hypothetical protein
MLSLSDDRGWFNSFEQIRLLTPDTTLIMTGLHYWTPQAVECSFLYLVTL